MGAKHPPNPGDDRELRDLIIKKDFRIDKLENEIASLKEQLAIATEDREPNGLSCANDGQVVGGSDVLSTDYEELHRRHLELQRKHNELQVRHEHCAHVVKQAMTKYAAAKESAKQWKAYINTKLSKDLAHDKAVSPAPTLPLDVSIEVDNAVASNDHDTTPKAVVPVVDDFATVRGDHFTSRSSPDPAMHRNGLHIRSSPPASDDHVPQVTSSQTTEGDENFVGDDHHVVVKQESEDEPVVVSARTVKRRRSGSAVQMPPPRKVKREQQRSDGAGSAEKPFQLKSDEYSPPRRAGPHQVLRQETSDLDHLDGLLRTPRRGLHGISAYDRAASEETAQPNALRGHGLFRKTSSSLSDGDLPDMHELMRTRVEATTMSVAQQPSEAEDIAHLTAVPPGTRSGSERAPLRRISPNVRSIPRTGRIRRGAYDDAAVKAACLAEDGDETISQVVMTRKGDSAPAINSASAHRLGAMLSDDTPSRLPVQRRLVPPNRKSLPKKSPPPTSHPRTIKTEDTAARPAPAQFRLPRGLVPVPPAVRPEEEPLRLRHPSALSTSDFRINPAYQNTSFAFADSIRGRETRRCLPNCTLPTCCGGQFLEMARAGALPPTLKSRSDLLEDYLGSNWEETMQGYDDAKRKETVLEARAHDFASKHGKHREVFTRRASPPGYWNTGMPSTQEEEVNREKARAIERDRVEGMWRDAMRGGGRWVFRNE
ncbi:hypothetical protein B0A48_14683 [Cryoendolithus antarcticus]|uniref:DNA endonuclease activator Ctp1 C-terminal domain-containing protein n=1 Tax=Cryoendolithus antarcticus TaxID=1507870 RepID=A0A1V8SKZ3_9PEZI|nr:hypothetical protein B0A48_14683 [Cryoendolithus antarcticus]